MASRGYHVYKTTSWINTKVGDRDTVELETIASLLETDPYACAIKIKNKYFSNLIRVEHIARKILWHVHFSIKTEGGNVNGHVKSLTHKLSPIASGGLEIPLQLTYSCEKRKT